MTIQFNEAAAVKDKARAASAAQSALSGAPARPGVYRAAGKALLDYSLILLALPVVIPVILICALAVALDGGAPFYWQRRLGRGGAVFHILKIRTMVPDAHRVLQSHLAADPAARQEWNHKQKLKNDPRITAVGRFLRKTSMDELPQLWNVLKGEMSLVGPRPIMVEQAALYPGLAYYRLRPGITGSWQVSDRNHSSFAGRARFDTAYFRTLSLKADLVILWRTIGVVLRGTGC